MMSLQEDIEALSKRLYGYLIGIVVSPITNVILYKIAGAQITTGTIVRPIIIFPFIYTVVVLIAENIGYFSKSKKDG